MKSIPARKRKAILDAIRRGLPLESAARYAEVNPVLLHQWLAEGRETGAKGVKERFAREVGRAASEFQMERIDKIREGDVRWGSQTWLLEHVYPSQYGKKVNEVQQSADDASPASVIFEGGEE